MQTRFLPTAARRIMKKKDRGVILSLTATPGGISYAMVGGFGPTCCAIESFQESGRRVGRVWCPNGQCPSAGSPDSRPFIDALEKSCEDAQNFIWKITDDTMLKQLPLMADIANAAVFLSSSMADKITGVTIDLSVGTTNGLNYKLAKPAFI
jgi:hypothetical protein